VRTSINVDEFGTLIIQLRALGLIEKSERDRSVKDRGSYWTLTPYGDQHLTTLRAIPAEPQEAHEDVWDFDEEDEPSMIGAAEAD
jgi:DNA-binding PadR family transcriptional regulator